MAKLNNFEVYTFYINVVTWNEIIFVYRFTRLYKINFTNFTFPNFNKVLMDERYTVLRLRAIKRKFSNVLYLFIKMKIIFKINFLIK